MWKTTYKSTFEALAKCLEFGEQYCGGFYDSSQGCDGTGPFTLCKPVGKPTVKCSGHGDCGGSSFGTVHSKCVRKWPRPAAPEKPWAKETKYNTCSYLEVQGPSREAPGPRWPTHYKLGDAQAACKKLAGACGGILDKSSSCGQGPFILCIAGTLSNKLSGQGTSGCVWTDPERPAWQRAWPLMGPSGQACAPIDTQQLDQNIKSQKFSLTGNNLQSLLKSCIEVLGAGHCTGYVDKSCAGKGPYQLCKHGAGSCSGHGICAGGTKICVHNLPEPPAPKNPWDKQGNYNTCKYKGLGPFANPGDKPVALWPAHWKQDDAQAACQKLGSKCGGYIGMGSTCGSAPFYLCEANSLSKTTKGGKCVWTDPILRKIAGWRVQKNKGCSTIDSHTVSCSGHGACAFPRGDDGRLKLDFDTKVEAILACVKAGKSACVGVHDSKCDSKGTWYMCSPGCSGHGKCDGGVSLDDSRDGSCTWLPPQA